LTYDFESMLPDNSAKGHRFTAHDVRIVYTSWAVRLHASMLLVRLGKRPLPRQIMPANLRRPPGPWLHLKPADDVGDVGDVGDVNCVRVQPVGALSRVGASLSSANPISSLS